MPTATLFTDLDELVIGELFYLDILNEVFIYEIVNIYVVLPSETENLRVQSDKDLVTLVTCTPYGVNSHRLLIQGERVESQSSTITPTSQEETSSQGTGTALDNLSSLILVAILFGALLFIAILIFIVSNRRSTRRTKDKCNPPSDEIHPDHDDPT